MIVRPSAYKVNARSPQKAITPSQRGSVVPHLPPLRLPLLSEWVVVTQRQRMRPQLAEALGGRPR